MPTTRAMSDYGSPLQEFSMDCGCQYCALAQATLEEPSLFQSLLPRSKQTASNQENLVKNKLSS